MPNIYLSNFSDAQIFIDFDTYVYKYRLDVTKNPLSEQTYFIPNLFSLAFQKLHTRRSLNTPSVDQLISITTDKSLISSRIYCRFLYDLCVPSGYPL